MGCTRDLCNETSDACDTIPDDARCDNGVFCDGTETCDPALGCQPGTPVDCDDGFSCTVDSCDPLTDSCVSIPDDAVCDDGLFCTGSESCVGGACVAGAAPCPGQRCDEDSGTCGACLTVTDCDDGLFCTGSESCVGGACVAGSNPCPAQACDEGTDTCGSCVTDADCDDGLFCNGPEVCDPGLGCQPGTDPCDGNACHEGVDIAHSCEGMSGQLWMSFLSTTTIPGFGSVKDEDIVAYDLATGTWSLIFDSSALGLESLEIGGMAVLPSGDILLSFSDAATLPGLLRGPDGTTVDDSDIVRFTPTALGENTAGTFRFYFDGSDAGLLDASEAIDAIALADDGRLIISTTGNFSGIGASGKDEDLFVFDGTSLGATTSGSFEKIVDGSDIDLATSSGEDIVTVSLTSSGRILLSTIGSFSVPGTSGSDEDVLELTPTQLGETTTGTYALFLRLAALGIDASEDIRSLELIEQRWYR
jgi:hypothetical protein